jgi:hypothetical protein
MEAQRIVKALGPLIAEASTFLDVSHVIAHCGFLALRAARIAYLVSKWPTGQDQEDERRGKDDTTGHRRDS